MFRLELDPPSAGARLATILIERPGSDLHALRPRDLDRLEACLDAVEGEADVTAVVLRSALPTCFLSGLDLDVVSEATDRRDLEAFLRRAAGVFDRLHRFGRPVVAAIQGTCEGAGLELALACRLRVSADSPATTLGLPEVELGLVPATGALVRLPVTVGLEAALDLVISGRSLRVKQASELGIVDVVVRPEALLRAAREQARRLTSDLKMPLRAAAAWRGMTSSNPFARRRAFKEARRRVQDKYFGLEPARLAAIDALARSTRMPTKRALLIAPTVCAELAMGDVARARMELRAEQRRLATAPVLDGRGREVEPKNVEALGIVGGGVMGADLAVLAAAAGLRVRIRERGPAELSRALQRVEDGLAYRAAVEGARVVQRWRSRISGSLDLRGFDTLDFVVEAVPEELPLKQRVFGELQRRTDHDAVLASHTRALPISEVGARVRDQGRLLGMHVFRPVWRMKLCEIVQTSETSPKALATAVALAKRIGKTPIVVRDAPGFFTTRVIAFYLIAAVELLMDGHPPEVIDMGAQRVGWPVGPLALMDELGLDNALRVSTIMAAAFPRRARLLPPLDRLVEGGRTGRATGRGFYVYGPDGQRRGDAGLWTTVGLRGPTRQVDPEELGERLTLVAALEAVRCLQEGIIATARDGDVAAVLGIGYPAHRGGPFRHLSARGLPSLRTRLRALQERFGDRYATPRLLEELASEGRDFASLQARVSRNERSA